MPRVCGRQRQQRDQNVGARQHRIEPVGAVEASDAVDGARRAAPARDVEADRRKLARRVGAEHAKAHDADANIGGRRLLDVLVPDLLILLPIVHALLAMMDQRVQHHPFAHPVAQIGIDHPHDRNIGKLGIVETDDRRRRRARRSP